MQTYAHYCAVVSARGVTPVTEADFNKLQTLPRVADVVMPHTLNYAVGVALEAGDNVGASNLINQCDEHDRECWTSYTTKGDYFPAGGLHFNISHWISHGREVARPLNVAFMLDFDGSLPSDLTFFEIGTERYMYDEDSLSYWDDEQGWHFFFYHMLETPTVEQMVKLVKSRTGNNDS